MKTKTKEPVNFLENVLKFNIKQYTSISAFIHQTPMFLIVRGSGGLGSHWEWTGVATPKQ